MHNIVGRERGAVACVIEPQATDLSPKKYTCVHIQHRNYESGLALSMLHTS